MINQITSSTHEPSYALQKVQVFRRLTQPCHCRFELVGSGQHLKSVERINKHIMIGRQPFDARPSCTFTEPGRQHGEGDMSRGATPNISTPVRAYMYYLRGDARLQPRSDDGDVGAIREKTTGIVYTSTAKKRMVSSHQHAQICDKDRTSIRVNVQVLISRHSP